MREIAVFIEGGGNTRPQQQPMRLAFQSFLKGLRKNAMEKRISFRVIMCGGRDQAIKAFLNEKRYEPKTDSFLLVDSEELLVSTKLEHISRRDHVDLAAVPPFELHLMITTMETWLCSDPVTLERFYGKGFQANQLPQNTNLEAVPKLDVCQALERATKDSQKGTYRKLRHGAQLIKSIDPGIVRHRCRSCEDCFVAIEACIDNQT